MRLGFVHLAFDSLTRSYSQNEGTQTRPCRAASSHSAYTCEALDRDIGAYVPRFSTVTPRIVALVGRQMLRPTDCRTFHNRMEAFWSILPRHSMGLPYMPTLGWFGGVNVGIYAIHGVFGYILATYLRKFRNAKFNQSTWGWSDLLSIHYQDVQKPPYLRGPGNCVFMLVLFFWTPEDSPVSRSEARTPGGSAARA